LCWLKNQQDWIEPSTDNDDVSDDWIKSNLASPGGSLKSKPMWRITCECFATSVFLCAREKAIMNETNSDVAQQLAHLARRFQEQRTGHAPKAVNVVLSEDTLIITLYEALTPAEKALARTAKGSAQVQEFHRRLFADSTEEIRQEIKRITGRQVREAVVEVETATGAIVHVFSTGAMVQVFLLTEDTDPDIDAV
jgi:uncharacterized protein YbcI